MYALFYCINKQTFLFPVNRLEAENLSPQDHDQVRAKSHTENTHILHLVSKATEEPNDENYRAGITELTSLERTRSFGAKNV